MARKKFELVADQSIEVLGIKLFRIRALISFGSVSKGDLGGYIAKEENLSQNGNAWIYGDAWVSGDARVYGDASIFWASRVGSENGTLTVFRAKVGLYVTRGCFAGTDDEFLKRVDEVHGAESKLGREYHLLIEVARSRIDTSIAIPDSDETREAA